MMSVDNCQEISNIICEYRKYDRKKGIVLPEFDRDHVERWINQFSNHQDIILLETLNLLNAYYISKSDIEDYLKGIFSAHEIWGEDIEDVLRNTCFLDCQEKGNSQHRLIKKSRKILSEMYDIDVDSNGFNKTSYAYIDDCMFSGGTVLKDIKNLIDAIPSNSTINVIFIMVHSFSEWWVRKSLSDALDAKGITLEIYYYEAIQNSGGRALTYECLWPQEYTSPQIEKYLLHINEEHEATPSKKVRLFRTTDYHGGKYTSEANRTVLEQELMEAGLKIINFSENSAPYIRPMGYDNRISFGFGAFFATYMNMSNNCPLAYWWGDSNASQSHPFSKWYPLLPRKANNGGELFEW